MIRRAAGIHGLILVLVPRIRRGLMWLVFGIINPPLLLLQEISDVVNDGFLEFFSRSHNIRNILNFNFNDLGKNDKHEL